jgi:hypothetical protein
MRTLVLLVALLPSIAGGQALDFADPWPEGSSRAVTLCFREDGRCSTSTSVVCSSATECPKGESCSAVQDVTPSALTYRVDAVTVPRTCSSGTKAGQGCERDADCPSSTCAGGNLLAQQTATPSAACHTITVPASANIVANAKASATPETHALTVCWQWSSNTECRELRFAVKRQRWS